MKKLFDAGFLDQVVFATAGGYLGETLPQIVSQKYDDLQCGDLYYEAAPSKKNYTEGKKSVCLWALKNYTMDWLRETIEKKTDEKIYVIFGLTESDSKSSCEVATQAEQACVKEFIVPSEEKAIEYPETYHVEYINKKGNSMANLVSGLFVSSENVCAKDLKKYYVGHFQSGKMISCKEIHSRRPCTFAELVNREALNDYLSQKQNTILDSESGVLIAELVYPFVVKLVS